MPENISHHPALFEISQVRPDGSIRRRDIHPPSKQTRERHGDKLQMLHRLHIPMPYAYGGVRGRNLVDNVEPHVGQVQYYLLDIKDAYSSVDPGYLRTQALWAVGPLSAIEVEDMSRFIQQDAQIDGVPGLPVGYPASPMLFNLYCREMDAQLGAYGEQHGLTYTRWLDDLTFSSPAPMGPAMRRDLRSIVTDTPGMTINDRKAKLLSGTKPVTITGISLYPASDKYPDGRMSPSPGLLERAKQTFQMLSGLLDEQGELDEEQLGILHGMNSILYLAGDPRESLSPSVRGLSVVYADIARRSLIR